MATHRRRSTRICRIVVLLWICSAAVVCSVSAIDDDVWAAVDAMSLKEKIGQMTQLDVTAVLVPGTLQLNTTALTAFVEDYYVGSLLNSPMAGGPVDGFPTLNATQWMDLITAIQDIATKHGNQIPIIYGLDSVHGVNYLYNATLFPQEIGAAATFNPDLLREQGRITAAETRALGIPWIFSPILGISTQPLWSRVYETFGEDPLLAGTLGAAIIDGLQNGGDLSGANASAACMKHFIGYPNARSGHDRTDAWIPQRYLREFYLPPFEAAVAEGVATAMINSGSVNGVPVHSSGDLLIDLLRDELGFNGTAVTDYQDIQKLVFYYHIAANNTEAARIAINETSIDMSMVPLDVSFAIDLYNLVNEGFVTEDRVTESAARIMQLKKDLGILASPFPDPSNPSLAAIGSPEHMSVARKSIEESVTLLQNNGGVLPLSAAAVDGKRILVTGPTADSLVNQGGGWTVHWQGAVSDDEFAYGTTVLDGIRSAAPAGTVVDYVLGSELYTANASLLANATASAANADFVVLCIGEGPYAEWFGDIDDLSLPAPQMALAEAMMAAGKPLVVVLIEGRPRVLGSIPGAADTAVLDAFLPGPLAGSVIADIIFGNVNPSGRLPITYPMFTGDSPVQYWHQVSQTPYEAAWEFGHGLSYSNITYDDMTLSRSDLDLENSLTVTVKVTNHGPMDAMETVLLFGAYAVRRVTPEVARLRAFSKVDIANGATVDVSFELKAEDFAFIGLDDTTKVLQSADISLSCGSQAATFRLVNDSPVPVVSTTPAPSHVPDQGTTVAVVVGAVIGTLGICVGVIGAGMWYKNRTKRDANGRPLPTASTASVGRYQSVPN